MKANSPGAVVIILTLSLLFLMATGSFANDQTEKLAQGMELLKAETARLGPANSQGPALYFGGTKMNENYEIVDKVKTKYDITATLFVKDDECFVRVSTNVITPVGLRAIGSLLDPTSQPITALGKGEPFAGRVVLFGKAYEAVYEPIRDTTGKVVGAYYVGSMLK
jgi:hypothetical protein